MSEVYFKLDIEAGAGGEVAGCLAKRRFAEASVSRLTADTHRVIRSRHLALEDNVENFCIVFPTSGTFEYRQHDKASKACAGEVYILNAQEPYEVDLPARAGMLCLALPCDLVRARTRGIDDLCGSSGFADPVIVSALCRLLDGSLDVAPSVDAERLRDLYLDMVDLMICPDGRRDNEGTRYAEAVSARVLAKARRFIQSAYSNPHLDVADVALACGVSVRQLQNAFRKSGRTFSAELLEQRLLAAFRLLRSTATSWRLIGDIAADCGFRSQAHFSTRFRQRFGHSPRDAR